VDALDSRCAERSTCKHRKPDRDALIHGVLSCVHALTAY
jgi:hypothetical protein